MRVWLSIRAIIAARWFWILLGAVLLALLIWFFGDLLAFGEVRPFGSDVAKLAAILVIALFWGLSNLWGRARARRQNEALVEAIVAPGRRTDPADAELAELARRFTGALEWLRKRRVGGRGGRRWLYELPWYIMIGPPGSGKTTALVQSGLRFPLESVRDLRGLGGTRYCDWLFTDEAVLIDTAGRYTTQDSTQEVDKASWLGFLDLLRQHRPRQPLNGVLVALSVRDLLEDRSGGTDHAAAIRQRLDELTERLGVRLPVYLILTKADLIAGFTEFFADLDDTGRRQVWGYTAPQAAGRFVELDAACLREALDELVARLDDRLIDRLAAERDLERRARLFSFPAQVQSLREEVVRLVERAFGPTGYGPTPWLRGVYLTSGTQTGTPVDRLVGALSRSFGVPIDTPPATASDQSFFLTRLLRDVVLGEASLVRRDPVRERREQWWRSGVLATLALVTVAVIGGWSWSYVQNRDRQLVLEASLADWSRDAAPVVQTAFGQDALAPILPLLDRLRGLSAPLREPDPWGMRLGLSLRASAEEQTDRAYRQSLANMLLPTLMARLRSQILTNLTDPDYVLEALKVYVMLGGQAPVDTDLVEAWFTFDFAGNAPEFASRLAPHIATLALDLPVLSSRPPLDVALIAQAQSVLRQIPLAKRAYAALVGSSEIGALPGWRVTEHAGPQASATLTRRSGRPLDAPVPGIFTYDGFHEGFLPLLDEAARAAFAENWVLGSSQSPEPDPIELERLKSDMLKLYYDDAIGAWDGLLRDVTLVPLGSLDQAVEATKALSGPSSPIKLLVQAIVRETSLTVPPATEEGSAEAIDPAVVAKAAGKLGAKLGKLSKLTKRIGKLVGGAGTAPAAEEVPGAPVERHFASLKALVEGANGAPPALDEAIQGLATLHAKLAEVSLSPNPAEAFARVGPTGAAQLAQTAARLPPPLNGMIGGIASTADAMSVSGIRQQLNAVWRSDVLPRCHAALRGRFPFDSASGIDANIEDVVQILGPGGMIDTYVRDHLAPFIDTTRRPWIDSRGVGLASASLRRLEQGRRIAQSLFSSGSLIASFTLTPIELSAAAASVTVDIDGQSLRYAHGPARPQPFAWPGPGGTDTVRVTFASLSGGPPVAITTEGPWSLFRLLRSGEFRALGQPDLFDVVLRQGNHYVRLRLRANSVNNPFNLDTLSGFVCPEAL